MRVVQCQWHATSTAAQQLKLIKFAPTTLVGCGDPVRVRGAEAGRLAARGGARASGPRALGCLSGLRGMDTTYLGSYTSSCCFGVVPAAAGRTTCICLDFIASGQEKEKEEYYFKILLLTALENPSTPPARRGACQCRLVRARNPSHVLSCECTRLDNMVGHANRFRVGRVTCRRRPNLKSKDPIKIKLSMTGGQYRRTCCPE